MAVVDRFISFSLNEPTDVLPDDKVLSRLVKTIGSLSSEYQILLDSRELTTITNDVIAALAAFYGSAHVLANPSTADSWRERFGNPNAVLEVRRGDHQLRYRPIDLTPFRDSNSEPDLITYDWGQLLRKAGLHALDDEEIELIDDELNMTGLGLEYQDPCDYWQETKANLHHDLIRGFDEISFQIFRRRWLAKQVARRAQHSLLIEFALRLDDGQLRIVPFHAGSNFAIEAKREVIVARPGVLASRTAAVFSRGLNELQELLAQPRLKEKEIQQYLERHPEIFRILGYGRVFPQVVLEREDGTSLRPDFIVQPIGEEWCDIVDIKLPKANIVVGRRDRQTLAAEIHELYAQLREYSAYFEDKCLAARIAKDYKIKCYRPRLIGIVGRDFRSADDRQLRRTMTTYQDMQIVTFDKLYQMARDRLLI